MKGATFFFSVLLSASAVFHQTMPELFQKAKEQIKAGSWTDAQKTLSALEAEAGKPSKRRSPRRAAASSLAKR